MNLFTKLGGTVALMLATSASIATAEAEFTMRIAAGASSAGNVCNNYLDSWAKEVGEKSGGRIEFKLYCDGTLAKMGDAVNRVQAGVADVAWDVPAAYGARFAGLNVVGVPGLYTDPEPTSGALWKTYKTGVLGEISDVKVLWLQVVNNNSWFMRKPLESYIKLDNAKFGMGSLIRAREIETMGGVPVALKVPEYYQAMSKGLIDGIMTTAGAIFDFGIEELLEEVYHAPFGGGITFVVMNNDFYNSLPDDLKVVIDETTGYERSKWASAYLREEEASKLDSLKGVSNRHATDEEIAALQPAFAAGRAAYLESAPENAGYLAAIEAALAVELGK